MRSAHSECRSAKLTYENSVMRASWPFEADVEERKPRQHAGDNQKRRGNEHGWQRAGCRRLVGFMLLGVSVGERRVRRMPVRRAMGMTFRHGLADVIVMRRRRILSGIALRGAEQRDDAGDDRAK